MFIDMQKFVESVGGGEVYTETTLWTNSSPTSGFDAQYITLSDDYTNYDVIRFYYLGYNNSAVDTTDVHFVDYPIDGINKWFRVDQATTQYDSYAFGSLACYYNGNAWCRTIRRAASGNNQFYIHRIYALGTSNNGIYLCTPYKITGLKKESVDPLNITEFTFKATMPTNSSEVLIMPTLGMTKLDATIVSTSQAAIAISKTNVSDWTNFTHSGDTSTGSVDLLYGPTSISDVDISEYNAIMCSANNRTGHPTVVFRLHK